MSRNRPVLASFVSLAALVLLWVSGPAFGADTLALRHAYKAGEKYVASVAQKMTITQTPPGRDPVVVKRDMGMEMRMDVLSTTPDGTADVKVTYERLTLRMEAPNETVVYDSADPATKDLKHPALAGFGSLLGQSLTMTITPRGEVKAVRGMDGIIEATLRDIPEGEQREAARAQIKRVMNEEHFSRQMSGLSMAFPEEAVGVGDGWDREQKVDLGFINLVSKTHYKVETIAADTVELSVEGTVSSDAPDPAAAMKVVVEEGSRQQGKIKLNRANPVLSTIEISQKMKMTISAGGRSAEQTVDGTATVTVKRAD